ncbi:DNRLRE domain-containing protein [Archaeoglobus neptunius]|uniref:DNRLRE domain-containing protein n=1 Tax=Archaeoglobus neptunius TaxID=2798580 RepID=UPI0019283E0A|nr:DNRLRE domain-containing protein [Archaeoglobus neptunius]
MSGKLNAGWIGAILFLLIVAIQSASAQPQLIGKWDYGAAFDVAASGNYLYVAAGEQVRIYDISTKAKIENIEFTPVRLFKSYSDVGTFREKTPPVSILHTNAGVIQALFIDGNYLYIAGEKKFVIADVTNPTSPHTLSTLNIPATDVEVKGSYAYAVSQKSIVIIDISDKTNPKVISQISVNDKIRRLCIHGNYLLTGGNDIFLYIYDISNPANPVLLGKWADPNNDPRRVVSSIAVKGNYAYVVDYHYGIHVVNISNPANPVEVNSIIGQNDPNANDIKVFGNYLFLSTRYEGFRVYDISNPENPAQISVFSGFPGYVEGIFVYQTSFGMYVFETGYSTGWAIVNVTDIHNPTLLARLPVPTCDSIAVKGNYAFYGGHNDGVWVVDISDPSHPQEKILIKNKGRNTGLAIDGNYLYIAGSWADLTIADISNPEDPVITVWNFGGSLGGNLIVVDNYLYAGGIKIFDVSDKHNPKLVYSADLGFGRGAQPLARYGNYLIFGGQNGLFIVDISNRTNPVVVANYSLNMYTGDAEIHGTTLFAVEGTGGIYSIDISNPANPKLLDSITSIIANKIAICGNKAYLLPRISSWGGMRIINISDPSNLKLEGTVDGVYGKDVAEYSGILYTTEGHVVFTGVTEIPLTISLLSVQDITQNSAVVVWQTNKDSDSLVEYGTASGQYTERVHDQTMTRYHSITLSNLIPGTTYYLKVVSTTGNETAASAEISFKTQDLVFTANNTLNSASSGNSSSGGSNGEAATVNAKSVARIYPSKDSRISPISTWNSGDRDLAVGSFDRYRTVLEFKLPEGTGEIKSIQLYLYVKSTRNSQYNHTIELYTLNGDFNEQEVNWTHKTSSEKWSTPGGDLGILVDHYNATGDLSGKWISFTLKGSDADNSLNLSWGDTVRLILVQKVTGDWHNKYRHDHFDSREGENKPYLVVDVVKDQDPPTITIISPANNSELPSNTDKVLVRIATNEEAKCQYATRDFVYGEGIDFLSNGTEHTFELNVESGKEYTFYYRCIDKYGNADLSSVVHKFSVQPSGPARIYPSKDSRISPISTWNSGDRDLAVGSFDRYRTVLEFKLPEGTGEIKSIQLYLYVKSTRNSQYNHTIELYTLNGDFNEQEVNWTHKTSSEKWSTPGGDLGILVDHYNATGDLSGKWISFTLKGSDADNSLNLSWGDTVRLILVQKVTGDWHNKYRHDHFDSREGENKPYLLIIR